MQEMTLTGSFNDLIIIFVYYIVSCLMLPSIIANERLKKQIEWQKCLKLQNR